jgi:predicted alpha/beta-hydrolase family hydrolase
MEAPAFLFDGPENADLVLALTHGAGAAMDSPFMASFAEGLRRADGKRRPPNPPAALRACWLAAIEALGGPGRLVIGGKSMGGRIASLLADEAGVRGLVCLGYPFHPAGRPDKTRTEHLAALATPTLIVQGSRDALGDRDEVAGYTLSPAIRLVWLEDGDHGFKPRKTSGRSERQNWDEGIAAVADFMRDL